MRLQDFNLKLSQLVVSGEQEEGRGGSLGQGLRKLPSPEDFPALWTQHSVGNKCCACRPTSFN